MAASICNGMFKQRKNSQKPGDEFLANFRSQFPEVSTTTASGSAISQTAAAEAPIMNATMQHSPIRSHAVGDDAFRDQDPTPRASNEPWRFTPSLFDPNSYAFASFANAPPGYYTPTPGGTNTLFHPQAGDLHTPNLMMGQGLNTPLSMPTSSGGIPTSAAAAVDLTGFQALQPHQLHHFNPFVQVSAPQQAYAPSTFVHQDTGYETMEQDGSPMDSDPSSDHIGSIGNAFQTTSPLTFQQPQFTSHLGHPFPASGEKFRFHSTLNAPTAMIKQSDEIPVTYLNKGQAYSVSIYDTNAALPIIPGTKYRTFIRISFEDDEQRQKPGVCWGLWKEGRGTSESHQRGGKLQAVEYVEAGQPVEGDTKRTRVELESSSFDGFSVTWTPGTSGASEANIAVRFNFLSTDFSHSKGVKGIPVRLCAKTSLAQSPDDLTQAANPAGTDATPEICFCKVKLFRDHGAERKLSNDVAHVKKSIDKLKHQLAQIESGMKDFGKRKRASIANKPDLSRAGKAPKHKRTWSMSSASSTGGGGGGNTTRMTVEEDLNFKLQTLQDMFTSTRPISVLYLKGEDLDDPDAHPVSMPGDNTLGIKAEAGASREGSDLQPPSGRSSVADFVASQSPSSRSLTSQASGAGIGGQWQNFDAVATGTSRLPTTKEDSAQPTKVKKMDDDGSLSGFIEALGVDQAYEPPEQTPKAVACFYVLNKTSPLDNYYRAIYLTQRNLKEFNTRVAAKFEIEPQKILRTIHTLHDGLDVEVDDDVMRELKEGQDMLLTIEEAVEPPFPTKREWEMSVDELSEDGTAVPETAPRSGYILRLKF